MKVAEFFDTGDFSPGDKVTLKMPDGTTEVIWIGHATPFQEPSENDGGIGWNYEGPYGQAEIINIQSHGIVTK